MSRKNEYYSGGLGADPTTDPNALTVTPSGNTTRQGEKPWYETLIQTTVPVLASAYQQNQMTKLNIARINQGQPPLSAEQYAAVYQPPSAQVQLGPDAAMKKVLMFGGLGLLAFFGLRAAKVI